MYDQRKTSLIPTRFLPFIMMSQYIYVQKMAKTSQPLMLNPRFILAIHSKSKQNANYTRS